jgi:hypothetical protein
MNNEQYTDDEMKAARFAYEVKQAFADTSRFCSDSLIVQDMQGRLVPFVWNPAQDKLDQAVKRQRAEGLPVRLIIVKSRRVGFSTGVAGIIFKETPFVDGQPALVVAHEKRAVKDSILPMYDRFQKHYKPFMGAVALPELIKDTEEGLAWANRSSIDIQTANNLEGARSFNYRRVHLSEYAYYRNIRHFMTALIPTVPDDPDTIIVKESTANGFNEFYDEWMLAVEGKSSYLPIFFGCFDDPNNWKELTQDPELFSQSITNDEWDLIHRYNLYCEQINWRRHKLAEYKNDENLFNQEYPHSAEVAFLVSGRPRFNPIFFVNFNVMEPRRGELHMIEERGHKLYEFRENPSGALHVWRPPQTGRGYILGGDPAKGVDVNQGVGTPDPDYAVGQIFDATSFEQVAMLRERLTPIAFARYIYDLGQWYKPLYVVVEVETNGGNGAATLIELIGQGYPAQLIHRMTVMDHISQRQTDILGYQISSRTKPQLISNWERLLYERVLSLYCAITIGEHRTFVYNPDGSVGAQKGRHDDTVTGCMMAGIGLAQAPKFVMLSDSDIQTLPKKYGWGSETEAERQRRIMEARRRNSIDNLRRFHS